VSTGRLRARLERLERSRGKPIPEGQDGALVFYIDPAFAKSWRDDCDRMYKLEAKRLHPDEHGGPPTAAELEEEGRLRISVSDRMKTIECPIDYGPIRRDYDKRRRSDLFYKTISLPHYGGGPLTAAEDVEHAQLTMRMAAFDERPQDRRDSPAEREEYEYLRLNHPLFESIQELKTSIREREEENRASPSYS
jgi:hypothetical protein